MPRRAVGGEHAVEPREELLGAVVRVEDDRADSAGNKSAEACDWRRCAGNVHSVGLCDGADVVDSSDGTGDGGLLLVVCEAIACEEGGAALGDLYDDGGLDVALVWSGQGRSRGRWRSGTYRAASRTEFATEEEVTFWEDGMSTGGSGNGRATYDGPQMGGGPRCCSYGKYGLGMPTPMGNGGGAGP